MTFPPYICFHLMLRMSPHIGSAFLHENVFYYPKSFSVLQDVLPLS